MARSRFSPCLQVLPKAQQDIWPRLQPVRQLGFVLYGGTAIALRLGHRQSVDFDFFNERPLDKAGIVEALPFLAEATVLQDRPNTWTLLARPAALEEVAVKLSFFGTIGFGRYGEPQCTDDGIMQVASLDDLMATKVKVILQRVEAKDYLDIAAMLRAGVSLEKGLAIARQMFGPNFQPSESMKAMTWYEGGDLHLLGDADKELLALRAAAVRALPTIERANLSLALQEN